MELVALFDSDLAVCFKLIIMARYKEGDSVLLTNGTWGKVTCVWDYIPEYGQGYEVTTKEGILTNAQYEDEDIVNITHKVTNAIGETLHAGTESDCRDYCIDGGWTDIGNNVFHHHPFNEARPYVYKVELSKQH